MPKSLISDFIHAVARLLSGLTTSNLLVMSVQADHAQRQNSVASPSAQALHF